MFSRVGFCILSILILTGCDGITKPEKSPLTTPRVAISSRAAKSTSLSFLRMYISCLRSDQPATTDQCLRRNTYAAKSLHKNLEIGNLAAQGADPVTCALGPPGAYSTFSVASIRIINDKLADAVVEQDWEDYTYRQVLYISLAPNGKPLVSNVVCG